MTTQYSKQQIDRIRTTEVEILDVIVELCDKFSLKYSLAYGTLIGAVRHRGFIPWDDDIDIIMPREDYERLKKLWKDSKMNDYYIHDYYTDINCTNNFMKIRKKHTTFYSSKGFDNPKMSGIFIDIFPADRVPKRKISRLIQYCAAAINLLYSRQYTSGTKGLIGAGEKILLKVPRGIQISIRNKAERIKRHWNRNGCGYYVNAATIEECKKYFPENMFESFVELEFNGKKYKATAEYDGFLTLMYGNYMKLPPESERVWGHSPEILDFEHNLDELRLSRKN